MLVEEYRRDGGLERETVNLPVRGEECGAPSEIYMEEALSTSPY
jgi:hypothetical protein